MTDHSPEEMHLIDCHAWGLHLDVDSLNGADRPPWRHNVLDSPAIYIPLKAQLRTKMVLTRPENQPQYSRAPSAAVPAANRCAAIADSLRL
jgi:hypothetical protein